MLALIAALYLARAFFVPLLIGVLGSYMLRPVVDWLKALHIPRSVAAALVLIVLVGSFSWIAYALRDQATTMIEQLPEAAQKLRKTLNDARDGSPTALQNMQTAANEIQGAATDAGLKPGARVVAAREPEPTAWLRDYALAQSALLIAVIAQTPIVLLLTYFLLASGQHFRRKLVQFVGPKHQNETVNILEEINVQIQRYLLVTFVSNTLIGVCTWLAFRALGMEQAGVWGFAAGVLHFIPYLGPVLIALASGVAAFLQFGSPLNALAVAGVSLLVAVAIGMVFMTWLQSHFAHMNAAVLFIALLFFGWMWGVWGLLLSAPLVTIAKVICDRVESLKPVGDLLGR
ncbi:MAG: AI-2E family transporter [Sulfuricaulis sp.]|uniref:AI-2E family transporter n=1 Tax=Sulfuricaulis sp. TaxID=2003553 RepID=UPI0025F0A3F9|nr:AI-2E family transporter [Sulfuricaulis sp.]MCR4346408.1 AI-2E family transporter [Sulfuricaulis sp.]